MESNVCKCIETDRKAPKKAGVRTQKLPWLVLAVGSMAFLRLNHLEPTTTQHTKKKKTNTNEKKELVHLVSERKNITKNNNEGYFLKEIEILYPLVVVVPVGRVRGRRRSGGVWP